VTQGVLAELIPQQGWTFKPLWMIAPRTVEKGYAWANPLSVFLDVGVVPRSHRADNHNELGADLTAYLHVLPGDLVFNKLRTWQGGLGVSGHEGIVSPAYFVCRPQEDVWPRFLNYLLLAAPYRAELTRLSKWMPPSQFDISWDQLRTLPILLPPLEKQRQIADFLDDQVALLDLAMALRRQQVALLAERLRAQVSTAYRSDVEQYGCVRLGLKLRGLEQGWSPQCEDRPAGAGEYGVLKAGCVNLGAFRPEQHKALPVHSQPRLQYLVQPGDLLMSRASGSLDLIGSVALVPEGSPNNLILCDKVYRLSLDASVDPGWLVHVLAALEVREAIRLGTSGAEGMANNLPSGTVRALLLPNLPLEAQRKVSRTLTQRQEELLTAGTLLDRSQDLFRERKQALITAAVTGEFDVTTARVVA